MYNPWSDQIIHFEQESPAHTGSPVHELTEWVEEHGDLLYRFLHAVG
ncbi:MAG: hypothetical protein VX927_01820 [SAR324 cluster bacterium]|nr:hypothetical protein [SAR324 cluster bacterium]